MAFKYFDELKGQFEVEPKSKDVRGFDVLDKNGNLIGTVKDLLVDTENDNAINYAVVSGQPINSQLNGKDLIVPLRKMDIDADDRSAHLDKSLDELKGFPMYDSISDPDLRQKADSFWGTEMYQRPMEGRQRFGRPMRIPVVEERVKVTKEMQQTGEVDVTMEQEIQRQPITEEVHGERVDVERHKVNEVPLAEYEKSQQGHELKEGESITVPITEERIMVTKEPVVVEEITLVSVPVSREVTMEEEVKKEHVRVEEHKAGEHPKRPGEAA